MKIRVGRRQVEISNPEKIIIADGGVSKADMARYYHKIGPWLLPHVRDRALTLERYPDGIDADGFIQQEPGDYFPGYVKRASLARQSGGTMDHVIGGTVAALVYLANLGVVTLHMWASRIDAPDCPDRMIFDLDPADDDFSPVIESAGLLRSVLDSLGLFCLPMTTGSSGLHVVVPLDRRSGFSAVRRFARDVAAVMAARHPDMMTTEQRKEKRGTLLYLDALRNGYGQTGVAPYSVRARPGAPVAAPLDWQELRTGRLTARSYRIDNIFRRLGQKDDPWKGMARRARSLDGPRQRLDRLIEEADR